MEILHYARWRERLARAFYYKSIKNTSHRLAPAAEEIAEDIYTAPSLLRCRFVKKVTVDMTVRGGKKGICLARFNLALTKNKKVDNF